MCHAKYNQKWSTGSGCLCLSVTDVTYHTVKSLLLSSPFSLSLSSSSLSAAASAADTCMYIGVCKAEAPWGIQFDCSGPMQFHS
jgi:hypothetical protein